MTEKRKWFQIRQLPAWLLLTVFFLGLFCPTAVWAETSESRTIKVGYFQFDGYHDIDAYGNKSGYGYDFIQMMSRYDNDIYEFIGYDLGWSDMLTMLDNGEIDLLTNAAKTAEREEQYLYSDRTMGEDGSLFTVRDDNEIVVSGDYKTYDGIVVGSISGSIQIDEFVTFAREKGFTYTLKLYSTESAMEQALTDGEVDGVVSIGLRNLQNEKVIEQIKKSDMYVITRKEDTELMAQVNRAINRLDQESANWRSELFDKYYQADQGDNISFQADEIQYIQELNDQNTVLKAVVNPDRKPYSYYENGKITGIIPRIFEEVARRTGLKYEIQETKTRQEYQDLLASGEIDFCLDEIFSFSEAEEKGYKLTDPYLSVSLARIINRKFDGTADQIAILKEADIKDSDEQRLCENVDTKTYDSTQECIAAVEKGEVDATYVYAYAAQIAVNENLENDIRMNIMMDYGNEFSIGVPKERDPLLISVLNKGVNSIETEYIQNIIMDETDYVVSEVPIGTYLKQHPFLVASVLLFLGILAILAFLLFVRNRLLEEKTEQEAEFVQAMTYVCRTNEIVRNTNLIDRTITDYYLEDGQLQTKISPYVGFDQGNHNLIFHPDDYGQVVKRFDEKKVVDMSQNGGGEEYFECRSKNKEGQYRWYGYTMQAVPADAIHPCNYFVYKKDINDAKMEEIKDRQNLEDALKLAQKASQAKGQFMSRMSHEIRTPLNAVLGYLNMAKQTGQLSGKVLHCIDNSEIAARHLLNIINNVLDISAIESGKLKIAETEFDLKDLLISLQTIFQNQAQSKQILFQLDMENIATQWVRGDSLRLNQILMNLLSNALKFTPEGGHVTLTVREIRHSGEKVLFQFQVSDDGIGMSEEYQSRLYQSFEQESAETAVKYGGSGLGLSITRNLVTMMNGSIDVKSQERKGTTFTVAMEFGTSQFSRQRVLVIEQDQTAAVSIQKLLKGYGVKADVVDDIAKAVRKIQMRKDTDYRYEMCMIDTENIEKSAGAEMQLEIPAEYFQRPLDQSVLYNLLVKHLKAAPTQQITEEAADLQGIFVLLAEDNDMNMEIATDILNKAKIRVRGVQNGKEALQIFETSKPSEYQAILMDIQMPVMDGYEAARRIRKCTHPEAKTIPIIAMTANAFSEDVSAAISAGMNDHISKPVNFDKLYKSLRKYIK